MKKLIKLFMYLLFIIFLTITIFTTNKLSILLALIYFIILYKHIDKISDKSFVIILFSLALLIRIITIIYLDIPVMDDFKTMYEASKSLIKGNLSFTKDPYFINFSYQLGFVFIQSFFLKIFNNIMFLKIINSIVTSLIVVFIFLISRNITNSRSSKIMSSLYLLYFYPIYLNGVLTNQHLQALLMLIIIYLITKKEQHKKIDNPILKSILVGLLLGISNIIRSEAIVFIVSFILIGIINLTKKNYKKILKNLLITIGIFILTTTSINLFFKVNNISENGLKNNAPLWKFYVGLSDKYNGMYNEEDQSIFFSKDKEEQKELLLNRVKNDYLKFPVLFIKKEVITFTKSQFNIIINNDINDNILNIILYFGNGLVFLALVLFLIGIFSRRNDIDNNTLSILIILFVYFGVYLFIEVSPRYGYNLQMIIFILASLGVNKIINNQKQKKQISK